MSQLEKTNLTLVADDSHRSPSPTDDDNKPKNRGGKGRRKIDIKFIEDKTRRQITFSKRKAGLMKKAYELSTLTGTQILVLVTSETGHVYTFATKKFQPFVTDNKGKNLIQQCLAATEMDGNDAASPEEAEYADDQQGGRYNNSRVLLQDDPSDLKDSLKDGKGDHQVQQIPQMIPGDHNLGHNGFPNDYAYRQMGGNLRNMPQHYLQQQQQHYQNLPKTDAQSSDVSRTPNMIQGGAFHGQQIFAPQMSQMHAGAQDGRANVPFFPQMHGMAPQHMPMRRDDSQGRQGGQHVGHGQFFDGQKDDSSQQKYLSQ